MKELMKQEDVTVVLAIALALSFSFITNIYADLSDLITFKKVNNNIQTNNKLNKFETIPSRSYSRNSRVFGKGIVHKKVKRWLNGKPAVVNILTINPKATNATVKPSFASYFINNTKSVKQIVNFEDAIAGVNASYFKPDKGIPLGTSIIDGTVVTGPLFKRVTFGITRDKEFKMDKIDLRGEININDNTKLSLFNINQPVFSQKYFSVYTDKWGQYTPDTSPHYIHMVVKGDRVQYIKQSSVPIPRGGYVVVGPHIYFPKGVQIGDKVNYSVRLIPDEWNNVEYAIGGGPYLIKEGKIFIDCQRFSRSFLWRKEPRTAVGYTKSGTLILVTVDGRKDKVSYGATLAELAKIMHELGAYNAMNLDGGTSTQMVVHGRLVNNPSVKGGGRINNALVIILPPFSENYAVMQ